MKRYNVTVNGNIYQVEVEEVKEFAQSITPKAAPIPTPAAAPQQAAPQQPTATAPTEAPKPAAKPTNVSGEKIDCPMPGTIVKVNVTQGTTVKKGDVLLVLEAMKMENEIMSPVDGTVAQVAVAKGAAVNTGDLLVVIS